MSATNSLSGLLDTNILIDIIRRYPPAIAWANANATQRFAIPSLVRMELVWARETGRISTRSWTF